MKPTLLYLLPALVTASLESHEADAVQREFAKLDAAINAWTGATKAWVAGEHNDAKLKATFDESGQHLFTAINDANVALGKCPAIGPTDAAKLDPNASTFHHSVAALMGELKAANEEVFDQATTEQTRNKILLQKASWETLKTSLQSKFPEEKQSELNGHFDELLKEYTEGIAALAAPAVPVGPADTHAPSTVYVTSTVPLVTTTVPAPCSSTLGHPWATSVSATRTVGGPTQFTGAARALKPFIEAAVAGVGLFALV